MRFLFRLSDETPPHTVRFREWSLQPTVPLWLIGYAEKLTLDRLLLQGQLAKDPAQSLPAESDA
jgi:hypothetical protein